MSPDDRSLIMTLAREVGLLAGHVEELRGDVGGLRTDVTDVATQVRQLQLTAASNEGAVAATRHVAEQSGADAALSAQRRDRWITRVLTALSLVIAGYAGFVK